MYSTLSAVVVRFSRARSRYERQGVLVEDAALQRAEEECLADAEKRAAQRERQEAQRVLQDHDLVGRMSEAIRQLFPGCPPEEAQAIAAHTARRGSGRVGRTAAGRAPEADAITLAVIAALRHQHTRYDELLMKGRPRGVARSAVRDEVDEVIERWRHPAGKR